MNNPYKARFQITGTIQQIGEMQTFQSGFQKREIVVNTNANYPSLVPMLFLKDDCSKSDALDVGDEVSLEGVIYGKKWDGPKGTRFFTDLVIKSVMVNKKAAPATTQAADPQTVEDDNEMPF